MSEEEQEVTAGEALGAGCKSIIYIILIILALMSLGPVAAGLQLKELAEQSRIERGENR